MHLQVLEVGGQNYFEEEEGDNKKEERILFLSNYYVEALHMLIYL